MSFDERLTWLLLGGAIGFVLGYITRTLREIKEELDEVDGIVKGERDESGITRYPLAMDAALLLVIVITVWAAFASQKATNHFEVTQDRMQRITDCNKTYLERTILALNERTEYVQEQTRANVRLQKAQAAYIRVILQKPTPPVEQLYLSLNRYFDSLTKFVEASSKVDGKVNAYPYPTTEELDSCLKSPGEGK